MNARCPVCQSADIASLDARADMPILMNRLYPSAAEGRQAPRGPLAMKGCQSCGFVWNEAFDPSLIVYDAAYENDQTHSPAFAAHVAARVEDILSAVPAEAMIDFLEVGCGQGGFIADVARAAGARLRSAEGFDPAWRGGDAEGPAGARIHTCYFDTSTAGRMRFQPNVVASRHTIEHVPDPVAFLRTIREALGPRSQATLFIETPCVEWILRNEAMQDFFYEHCTLFTADSLRLALHRAGFAHATVSHVFGGQYLWARADAQGVAKDAVAQSGEARLALEGVRRRFTERWQTHLAERAEAGPVALWGAGAKGVNFALMVDPSSKLIDHVIDINPAKQGKYMPGSGIPVLSPEASAQRAPKTIYIMNPNYRSEIEARARAAGISAIFVPIN